MKILILGGSGMVGSNLYSYLKEFHEVYVSLRTSAVHLLDHFDERNCILDLDVTNTLKLEGTIKKVSPDIVINAVGITKKIAGKDLLNCININALLPHQLSKVSQENGVRLINLSTDCVFSGSKGNYTERSFSDAEDAYGRTKYLGEVTGEGILTIRKSTIGLEIHNKHGLIEWWLSQRGTIKGYRKAIYSGIITSELARVINLIINDYPELEGIWNIASEPISKFDLLSRLQGKLERKDIDIIPDDDFVCDRSLNGEAFNKLTAYSPPSWDSMISSLADEIKKLRF